MIVSHLNACNENGLSWVDEVLVTGLRNGDKVCNWKIEVHSSDDDDDDVDGGDNVDEDDEIIKEKDYGPAVYIVQKLSISDEEVAKRRNDDEELSKVALKFFGY